MSLDAATALQRGYDNCLRIYLMTQEQILNPTQANVDAIVAAAASNTLTPRPTTGIDGESISWESYAESLLRQMESLQKQMVRAAGPFEIRSRVTY